MNVLTELRNRGVADVFFIVCDGLRGLPDSVNTLFKDTIVQTCIVHLIRGTFRYASKKYWEAIARDLRPIYTAATAQAAGLGQARWVTRWKPALNAFAITFADRMRPRSTSNQ